MARVDVKVQSNLVSKWLPKEEKKIEAVALAMAVDIHREAIINAPVDKGNLAASGRIEKKGEAHYSVAFGGTSGGVSVPYARIRHRFNRKNPQTLKYLERAGESVAKKKSKYLKGLK